MPDEPTAPGDPILVAHGNNAASFTPAQKANLRREALGWLRDWLSEAVPTGRDLFLVKNDPAFRCVRHPLYLAALPPVEVRRWIVLWDEVRFARGSGDQQYAIDGPHI